MATLRDLRKRVRAVKNTQKITKAMKMVAASKLRRAQNAITEARPYALKMEELLQDLVSRVDTTQHPLLATRVPRRVELVVMTSNRGLCGSFNTNITRTADRWLANEGKEYESIQFASIGKKARDHLERKNLELRASYDDILNDLRYERASDVAFDLSESFQTGKLDAVYLLYNEFKSAISQNVRLQQLLPIRPLEGWDENPNVKIGELAAISGDVRAVAGRSSGEVSLEQPQQDFQLSERLEFNTEGYEHVYEPSQNEVLDNLLPQHLAVQVWRALLESNAAEHGARMTAMDAASRNASDLIESLSLEANRVRQANITTELSEIVTGAESLRAS
jgi:F-type H+-transporting ATPase subunit gamma